MSDPDKPDINFNLVRALHGAHLVVLDEDAQVVFTWHGGPRITAWTYEGQMEDQFVIGGIYNAGEYDVYDVMRRIDIYRRKEA